MVNFKYIIVGGFVLGLIIGLIIRYIYSRG